MRGKHARKNTKDDLKVIIIACIIIFAIAVIAVAILKPRDYAIADIDLEVSDYPITEEYILKWQREIIQSFEYNADFDLQNPQLPTGCEATAFSILLRMNGVCYYKTEIADLLPHSTTDFVNSYIGNPYTNHGWLCESPCIYNLGKKILEDTPVHVYQFEGLEFKELPTPCMIWVTMGMKNPYPSDISFQGYSPLKNTHCIVVNDISIGMGVYVTDPLVGRVTYDYVDVKKAYEANGSQCIYLSRL